MSFLIPRGKLESRTADGGARAWAYDVDAAFRWRLRAPSVEARA